MTVRLKVGGVTSPHDAELAVSAGAWGVSVSVAPGRPRFVRATEARAIFESIPSEVTKILVFRDQSLETLQRVLDVIKGVDLVLLGGTESDHPVQSLGGARVIKRVVLLDPPTIDVVLGYSAAFLQAEPGSSSSFVDEDAGWESLAAGLASRFERTILGGPFTADPESVRSRVLAVRPWAVTVTSAVEVEPGRLDASKLQRVAEGLASAS